MTDDLNSLAAPAPQAGAYPTAQAAPSPFAFVETLVEGVYGVDTEGLCTFVNHAALTMLGYETPHDLLGRQMHEAIHHTRPDGSPFPTEACPLLHTLTSGRAVRLDRELLWRRDGSSFVATYSSFPLVENGIVTGSIITFLEMPSAGEAGGPTAADLAVMWGGIEQRQADEALRTSETKFRTLADSIPQLAWMTDASGSIEWYNRRWYDYTGTTPDQMLGWGWRDVQHPDHIERVVESIGKAFSSGTPWEDTFPLRGGDGGYRWFLSRAMPIYDRQRGNGRRHILGWFGTNTDITDLREAEERLSTAKSAAEEANRSKSEFIANMSHELRTPLSAIIGYSEMMQEEIEDSADPADLATDLGKIESNARHLLGLINDVLDLSKIESGKMEVFPEAFEVAPLIEVVSSTVQALVQKKGNTLNVELGDGLGAMRSDVTKLRQILLNLLSNAAKFTEGGTITLSANRFGGSEDWLAFRVSDTGIGMSEEQLAKLFMRFSQADASTTRRFGGTGLGLSISKAFSVMLGGDIAVESAPGRGTSFSVLVPAVYQDRDAGLTPEEAQAGTGSGGHARKLVLVIDDDQAQRDLMSRFLAREGFAARTAADGQTGLQLARVLRPSVILLDVMMPGMDGWSVLSALKADPALAGIPVVMITFVSERGMALALGASEYVPKPVEWSRFKVVMDRFRGRDGHVLVVDDDADARHRMRVALERDGWTVVEAGDGQEGLDRVAEQRPAIVLLDLVMPELDGFGFLQRLRERPDCAEVPVVVLTSQDLSRADRARLRGASQVLNKGSTTAAALALELGRLTDEPVADLG